MYRVFGTFSLVWKLQLITGMFGDAPTEVPYRALLNVRIRPSHLLLRY